MLVNQNLLNLKIITPEKMVYHDDVYRIVLPTESGQITILPNHQPLVTIAITGEIKIEKPGQDTPIPLAISSGIVEVRESFVKENIKTEVIVLAYRAEFAYEIDINRAKEAYNKVLKVVEAKKFEEDVDFAKFQAMMDKEVNRMEIFKKWNK